MINTVSDFLEEFKKKALGTILKNDSNISHTPTIGNMYEGLTSEILNQAIFKDLDLRIVNNSFIYNDQGKLSDEIDCMLVAGEGTEISFTKTQFKYHVKNVIAVFQVKKNLYKKDLDEAHENLQSVNVVAESQKLQLYELNIFRDAYRALTSTDLPDQKTLENFNDRQNTIYNYLLVEATTPLRIVIGYYGYSSEYTLREGFVKLLQEKIVKGPVKGYHPQSFPSLIICGNSTILKNNGMPMGIPLLDEEYYFPILVSSANKPMYHLLELIWTRLSYKFEISSTIFGNDFGRELSHTFLSCAEKKVNDSWGWDYSYFYQRKKDLAAPLGYIPWSPIELCIDKFKVVKVLIETGEIDIANDSSFLAFIEESKIDIQMFINSMVSENLIYARNNKIRLFIDEPLIISHDGKVYIGENKNLEMETYFLNK